jgi:Ca2+-binding RTX toxin-like protein
MTNRLRCIPLALALLVTCTATAGASADTPRCGGKEATHVGTNGPDHYKPQAGAVIVARGGNDTFGVFQKDLVICGGPGNDRATFDGTPRGQSRFFGEAGNDRVVPSTGDLDYAQIYATIVADGGPGDDLLIGAYAGDRLAGGRGADKILGNHNSDRIEGGPGKDRLFANNPATEWVEGHNRVAGGAGDDRIFGSVKRDRLLGEGGDDFLKGNGGDDTAVGGPGRDECRAVRTRSCEL